MKTDYAAQCRFFTAEDACRIALKAYYAASRHIEPPPGEAWMQEGTPWASATDFAEAFSGQVQARLALLALQNLGEFYQVSETWSLLKIAEDIEPEKMAPIIAAHEAMCARVDAEFLGDAMNRLPGEDNRANNANSQGVGNASFNA